MERRDLPGHLGTEVRGPASTAGDVDELRAALDQRHLLIRRGRVLSSVEQVAFTARFGPLVPDQPLWSYVSNTRPDGIIREGGLLHHADLAFTRAPLDAICLHAIEVPSDGAPTSFANAVRAAANLPTGLRRRIEGRQALNVYDFRLPNDRPMRVGEIDPRSPRWAHPVLAEHPRTGVPVIMASELHTDSIVGLPRAESDALLADLFAVLYDDDNVYEHRWTVGDLVLWDNIALQHARRGVPSDEERTLRRTTVGAYTVRELVPDLHELYEPPAEGREV